MPIVTLNGLCGGGSQEIGTLLAQSLGLNYIDRMIMKVTAEKIGTDIAILEKKEQRSSSFLNKNRRTSTKIDKNHFSQTVRNPPKCLWMGENPSETKKKVV